MNLTAGYDVFAQIHEKVINKSMALLFYSGKICVNGTFELVKNPSEAFAPYNKFDYEITLTKEPFVDFVGYNKLYVRFGSQVKLRLFDAVDIYFSLDFSVDAKIVFDFNTKSLQLNLKDVKILSLMAMNKAGVSRPFVEKLNHIVKEILNKYFADTKTFELPTVPLQKLQLPAVATALPVVQGDVLILDDRSVAVGISFSEKKGKMSEAKNLLGNTDCYIAISDSASTNILKYWWDHKANDLKVEFDETKNINFASSAAGKTTDILTRVFTLGFIQTETEYDNMMMQCKGDVSLNNLPGLDFTEDGKIALLDLDFIANVTLKIDALKTQTVTLDKSSFIPDSVTKFEDDVLLSTTNGKQTNLVNVNNTFKVKVNKAAAELVFSSKNDGSLAIKVTDVDFKVEFDKKGSTFSDVTWTKLMAFVKQYVIDKIPEITVSPSIILDEVKIFDNYTLSLKNSVLKVADNAIAIETDVNVNEINANESDVPNYIVDMSKKVVHDFSCDDVYKITRKYRKGYFVMYEALAKGFTPCAKCLNGYTLIGK